MRIVWSVLLSLGLLASTTWAANKVYVNPESSILFADSAQVEQATWTLSALAAGAGRISAQYDRGAGAHAAWYEWRCRLRLTGTNVVGAVVEFYVATSDGTYVDGNVGTADAALASDKRNNLRPLGVLLVDQTTTNTEMVASGRIRLDARYLSLGIWNGTSLPLQTDTANHGCLLTPMPEEVQ